MEMDIRKNLKGLGYDGGRRRQVRLTCRFFGPKSTRSGDVSMASTGWAACVDNKEENRHVQVLALVDEDDK